MMITIIMTIINSNIATTIIIILILIIYIIKITIYTYILLPKESPIHGVLTQNFPESAESP